MEYVIILLIGLLSGGVVAWFIARNRFKTDLPYTPEELIMLQSDHTVMEQRLRDAREENETLQQKCQEGNEKNTALSVEVSRLDTMNKNLGERLESQKKEFDELNRKMQEQFENIASRIVLNNSRMIQQQHSDKLADILNPLKEKIEKFQNTVNDTHKENIRENQSLKEQLRSLQELNRSIGEEARNLTTALKGQVKTQGNWGEMILESILERSGLVKDREYVMQESLTSEEGRRFQPDVLVKLPENKTIIIDSKVSLVAYEKYSSADNREEQETALKEHLTSIRRHIRGLGEKKYQHLYDIRTLDFVLLFIPVEPAFSLAIQYDNTLFNDAFESNIVIVSPSTLLATLRTISSIWKLEYQNKNALEIARQGGALYDKFVGFLTDFQKVGDSLTASHKLWESAFNKLSTGKGNLVTSVEKLRKLGAASSKSIPLNLQNDAEEGIENDTAESNS